VGRRLWLGMRGWSDSVVSGGGGGAGGEEEGRRGSIS